MKYKLIKELIDSVEKFEEFRETDNKIENNLESYKKWLIKDNKLNNLTWEGKENGRSIESVINTLIVHLNRYAKSYSKSVIHDTKFVSQEDFIYLINLKAFGSMTKMELIKKNIHEKSPGMQIINRLIAQKWIEQVDDVNDKRSKLITITQEGINVLENSMDKIREASNIVTGDLTNDEKLKLIYLLQKLDHFHFPIYSENIKPEDLLDYVDQKNNLDKK